MPLCKALGDGLWELRSDLRHDRIARIFICFSNGKLIALHAFVKKTQKTPKADLDLARKRKAEFMRD